MTEEARDWISAWEALSKVRNSDHATAHQLEDQEAEAKLREAFVTGKLRAAARFIIQEADNGAPPNFHVDQARDIRLAAHVDQAESEFALFDCFIPGDFFAPQLGWNIADIRWEVGRVVATRALKEAEGATRRYIDGLIFDRASFEGWLQNPQGAAEIATASTSKIFKARANGGRPPKLEEWHKFWQAVLSISEAEELNQSNFKNQAALRNAILEKTGDKLSEATIKPVVRDYVWYAFVEKPGSTDI